MTALDQHIISSLISLSDEGKDAARKILGAKKRVTKTDATRKQKMIKSLFKNK